MDRYVVLEKSNFPVLAPSLSAILRGAPTWLLQQASEIRLRIGQPLMLIAGNKDYTLGPDGQVVQHASAYLCSSQDLTQTLQLISRNSLYAFEQELKQGFITVPGGHRIGLAGQAIIEDGELKALKNIGAMNIRLAREMTGAADKIMSYVIAGAGKIASTLVIAPPRCGKTTLLRDLVRQLSIGVPRLNFSGVQVGLVDERSEIAACRDGVPTAQLGPRVDVLDGCPKAEGMLMLIRSMAPQVVVTDELGREADARAVKEALHAGVAVVASVHGKDEEDVLNRPYVGELLRNKVFDRYITLSDTPSIGTLENVVAARTNETLYRRPKEVRECG